MTELYYFFSAEKIIPSVLLSTGLCSSCRENLSWFSVLNISQKKQEPVSEDFNVDSVCQKLLLLDQICWLIFKSKKGPIFETPCMTIVNLHGVVW